MIESECAQMKAQNQHQKQAPAPFAHAPNECKPKAGRGPNQRQRIIPFNH